MVSKAASAGFAIKAAFGRAGIGGARCTRLGIRRGLFGVDCDVPAVDMREAGDGGMGELHAVDIPIPPLAPPRLQLLPDECERFGKEGDDDVDDDEVRE